MKCHGYALLSFVAIASAAGIAGDVFAQSSLVSKWEKVGPVHFTALVHQSPSTIVATTSHGYLYITHDDGTTWQRREVADTLDLRAISFGDSLHGVILVARWSEALFTTDGGVSWEIKSWQKKDLPILLPLYVDCIGADTIFMVNWIGNIYRSIDGGATWLEQYKISGGDTLTMTNKFPSKIIFFDNQRGYVLGDSMYVETSDAGEHWNSRGIVGQDGPGTTLYDIDFYNRDTGVMSGSDDYFTTSDAGATWTDHPMPHDLRLDEVPVIRMFGPKSFFMFGTPNAYYYTSNDFGATFTFTDMRRANSIEGVVRTQSGGWLAMGGGWLGGWLRTHQYGAGGTIIRGVLPPENATTPVWTVLAECPMGRSPLVHATNGEIFQSISQDVGSWLTYPLLSTDSGIFWHVTDLRYNAYFGFHFPSPDTGYLYGYGRTLDSGRTWNKVEFQNPVAGTDISDESFGSRDVGYVLTRQYPPSIPIVVATTDCGLHWHIDSLPPPTVSPYPGYNIFGISPQRIFAVDALHTFVSLRVFDTLIVQTGINFNVGERTHNVIYHTTDGGTSWSNLEGIPLIHEMGTIYFRNSSVGFLTCDSGRIYRTSDGGNNWALEQLASIKHSFTDINFLNDRIGFASCDSSEVFATTDGGLNWSGLKIPASGVTTGNIYFPDSNTVLVSAEPYSGLYRAKLNIPHASIVEQQQPTNPNALSISTYPNPARDAIHVQVAMRAPAPMWIDLLDILGRTVYSCAEMNADFALDVASLPNGVYTLRCAAGGESATTSFTLAR